MPKYYPPDTYADAVWRRATDFPITGATINNYDPSGPDRYRE